VKSYVSLAAPASAEIEVKRSRFLAVVAPVSSEEAARAVIDGARREHWDARHHCSAFVLGPTSSIARSSDDGEPSGTAGAPMLEVLRGAGLTDTVAVVTRWFGGTLLGAGGLVRAYGDAVRAALDVSTLKRFELVFEVALRVSHADAGRLESDLRGRGVRVLDVAYDSAVTLLVGVPEVDQLAGLVAELTAGTVTPVSTGQRWLGSSL
jgi:uncharacterized YigZ family protein